VPTDHLNLTDFSLIFCFLIHQRQLALARLSANPIVFFLACLADPQAAQASLKKRLPINCYIQV
jgi:hypothetical protein